MVGPGLFLRRVEGNLVPADLYVHFQAFDLYVHFQAFDLLLEGPIAVFVMFDRGPTYVGSHLLVLQIPLSHDIHILLRLGGHLLIEGLADFKFPTKPNALLKPVRTWSWPASLWWHPRDTATMTNKFP